MKKLISMIGKALTILATWISLLSLRGLVIIIGILLSISVAHQRIVEDVDNAILQVASYIFPTPLGSSDIAIVTVPREEVRIWQSDVHSSGKLAALLANVLNSSDAVVGIILQQPMDTGAGAADVLIESYLEADSDSDSYKKAKPLVDRKYILMDLLSNGRVVVGVERFFFSGQKPILRSPQEIHRLPSQLQILYWPHCQDCMSMSDVVQVGRPGVSQYPILDFDMPRYQTFIRASEDDIFSGFLVQFLRAVEKLDNEQNLVWDEKGIIGIGSTNIRLSPSGHFIPLHNVSEHLMPLINEIPLNEALVRNAFPKYIFIAADGSQTAQEIAKTFYSVIREDTFYSPWWLAPLNSLIILLVTLYLGLGVTRLSTNVATSLSAFIFFSLLIGQIFTLYFKSMWLSLALPMVWLLAGHFLLRVWTIKKRRIQKLVDRADEICIENARQLLEEQQPEKALQQIQGCSTGDGLLQTLYEISEVYTAQKNYAEAIHVLSMIKSQKKSYKDTEQKLEVLSSMLKTEGEQNSEHKLQKTMVINTQTMEERTLGRYKLEREIGRGAMGQVYLGFDPRISRRVAIKTLNYEQFKDKGKDDIKTRFFREAEAAGRLSHPSIISVFDVGEEDDLAFIAMDFAEGKPLNHFVKPENLLPVFEVYRIICDVAMALEYAHENNVVHRDIKPGNIIYNPSPYQIKVTDFGIARLVDDSKTSTGEILGSPLYMAPEQLKGKRVNRSADIFSLGVTFYQLLTGQLPYAGDNLAALSYEIIHGKHKGVRTVRKDLPASASRITNQALQKDPGDRYETAAEMAMVLKKAIKRDFANEAKRAGFV